MSLPARLATIERAAEQLRRASILERPAFFAALGESLLAWSREVTADVQKLQQQYEALAHELRQHRPG